MKKTERRVTTETRRAQRNSQKRIQLRSVIARVSRLCAFALCRSNLFCHKSSKHHKELGCREGDKTERRITLTSVISNPQGYAVANLRVRNLLLRSNFHNLILLVHNRNKDKKRTRPASRSKRWRRLLSDNLSVNRASPFHPLPLPF